MMKCKFHCGHFKLDKLFKMDSRPRNGEKCSCDEPDLVEIDFCEASSSKDKRSKMNLFGLCRDKSLPFSSKRNKKSVSVSASSTSKNIVKKSPKWGIKFNCTKKETKTAFNPGNQNNCCRCTCYKHKTDIETLPGQSTSEFVENHEQLTEEASTSKNNYNGNEMDVAEYNTNSMEESANATSVYSVLSNPAQSNNLIVTAPFSNMHW